MSTATIGGFLYASSFSGFYNFRSGCCESIILLYYDIKTVDVKQFLILLNSSSTSFFVSDPEQIV